MGLDANGDLSRKRFFYGDMREGTILVLGFVRQPLRSGAVYHGLMVATASQMLPLNTKAPAFALPDTEGYLVSLDDQPDAKAYLVVFMCNHCPFVQMLREELAALGRDAQKRDFMMVGINSNNAEKYPADSPELMQVEVAMYGYVFPYLVDADQSVAKAFHAACTPDFFLFDADQRLVYRGQLDDARPGNGKPVTGKDLRTALDAVLAGTPVPEPQTPSMGCNIKWKPGNEPEWFG